MRMIDAFRRTTLILLVSQILLDIASGHPVVLQDGERNKILKRNERSIEPMCGHKKHLTNKDGIIVVNHIRHAKDVSCSWIIHVPRGTLGQFQFSRLNIEDSCPGICECNYVAVKEHIGRTRPIIKKYCNERKPFQRLVSGGDKVRIHLRLKAGSQTGKTSFVMKYSIMSGEKSKFAPQQKSDEMLTQEINAHQPSKHDTNNVRVRKQIPSAPVTDVEKTAQPTQDPGPSKLTILLAIAIPVVLIFIFVVLLIAYYNYYMDMKQKESGEEIPKSGTTISDLIMNSSVTLTPMFNLGKARRESTQRKEKANKLYDDMLQNWRLMNDDKKKREQAKEESVNTWESYKKHKQRRNTRETSDSKAFAMLVSNAINVVEPEENDKPEVKETTEEVEETPGTNSILIKRDPDHIRNSRGSKVLSWSDISTTKPEKEDENSKKRTKSETEIKTLPRGSRGSGGHIPAIVVSQPSVDTEDDEPEATDTDRLIKDDSPKKPSEDPDQDKNTTTYSCSEHVKDILRESYGDEVEKWFQKPKETSSQDSAPDSTVKYQAMKPDEDEDID